MLRSAIRWSASAAAVSLLAVLDASPVHAQSTFRACRVPNVGAIYMIGVPGAPAACLDASHVEFSWSEGGSTPADGSITTAKLANGSVTNPKLADGSVTSAKIGTGAVLNSALGLGAVQSHNIAAGAANSAAILDGAVGSSKLAAGAVMAQHLGAASVNTSAIADGAVTASKIPDRSIATTKLAQIVAMKTHTVGWGSNVACGGNFVGGAGTLPGAMPGDVVVMTNLHPNVMSSWARHTAFVSSPGNIGVQLTIESTGCPGPATVGPTPVLIVVYRP